MRYYVTSFVIASFLFGLVSSPIARAQSDSTSYGTNLITNGDAENDFGANDAVSVVKPTGWTTTGAFSVVRYGAKGDFPDDSTQGSVNGGQNFFAGGDAAVSTASQTVSLAPYAADIDAGRVTYALSAKLGGWGSLQDRASVTVTFKDAQGAALGTATIGPVEAQERLLNTALVAEQQSGSVPAKTRTAAVDIVLKRAGSSGYNHAFADSVSLILSGTPSTSTRSRPSSFAR